MPPETVTRELFWQIGASGPFYAAAVLSLAVFAWGLARAIGLVRRGARVRLPAAGRKGWLEGLREACAHRWAGRDRRTLLWHGLVFFGWWALVLVTLCLMLAEHAWPRVFQGGPYRLLSLLGDAGGTALAAGACLALTAWTPGRSPARRVERAAAFGLLIVLCLSGFLLEGLRMARAGDPAGAWSPVGGLLARLLTTDPGTRFSGIYPQLWWLHGILALAFVAAIPFSRSLQHLIFLLPHRAGQPTAPRVLLPAWTRMALPEDVPEGSLRFGLDRTSDATPRQRLGVLACMDCGRCEAVCPAAATGQALSPRTFLNGFRGCLLREGGRGGGRDGKGAPGLSGGAGPVKSRDGGERLMGALDPEALWACRTCLACEEACPAGVGHVSLILELRRAEVLNRGALPRDGADTLWKLARTGNPYGAGPEEKIAWLRKHAPASRASGGNRRLLWPGCFPPGDTQKPRVLDCLVSLLNQAGEGFCLPPETVSCCGDPARVLGEEDLFLSHAEAHAAWIRDAGVREILVHCPHCHHTLREVAARFALDVAVVHTSALFAELRRSRRLEPGPVPDGGTVAYHDPCYLGRYHGIYAAPREILGAIPGARLAEAADSRGRSFCCGAGGGHFFMDLDPRERPASRRIEGLLACGAGTVAVSCPFCHAMFDDAARRLPEGPGVRVADWLELLRQAVPMP